MLQRLLDERAQVWSRMCELRDTAEAAGRGLDGEERAAYDTAEARLSELTADISREERHTQLDRTLGEPRQERIPEPGAAPSLSDSEQYERAFSGFMRGGMEALDAEQRSLITRGFTTGTGESRAQSAGTNSAGGYLVPSGYRADITETMKAYGGLLAEANVITTTTGNPLPWPGDNDTGNIGAILSENAQVSNQDLTITQQTLNAYTYTSKQVLVSLQLLQDSAFDLDAYVPKRLGIRIGRAVAAHLATGTGSSQPTGIGYAPTTGKTGTTGQTTTVIYDDLIDTLHSVDAAYRAMGNAKWAMNDLTLAAVRKIKDTQGHPLWQPSVIAGLPDTLLGYPVIIDNGLPVMAANAKSILFGDFHEGLLVRQVLDVQMLRLVERYADYLQVGFIGFSRLDAKPDDAAAVRAYVNSAT